MNCVRCGTRLHPGQAQCPCGQYVDLPASELYTRIESQVEQSSKDSFRRGLLIGLGFLLIFLILETGLDTVLATRATFDLFFAVVLLVAAACIGFNIWQLVQKLRRETDDY